MQHHRDQRRVELDAGEIDFCGIGDKGFNVGDRPFLLQALQIGKRFGRWIDGVDEPRGTDPLGK